jgi:heme exporter protein D
MNHWPFVIAAYGITIAGTVGIVAQSFVAMRRAEKRSDALTRQRDERQQEDRA